MNEIDFQWLTKPLSGVLTGEGVFVASLILGVIFVKKVCNNKSILYICTVRELYEWFAYVYNQL